MAATECPACVAKRDHDDAEIQRYHPRRWEYQQATRNLGFTKDFNSALEALMRDPMATYDERVMAWSRRYSWGNYHLYCVRHGASDEPIYQVDCAADLGIKPQRVSEVMQYRVARGYLELRGKAKVIFPVISPVLTQPDKTKKSGEYRTFLEMWQLAHAVESEELNAALATVARLKQARMAAYKSWCKQEKSGESGENSLGESPDSPEEESAAPRTELAAIKGRELESENLASAREQPPDLFDHLAAIARHRRLSLGAPNENTLRNFWAVTQRCAPEAGAPAIGQSIVRILDANEALRTWGGVFNEFRAGAARQILDDPDATAANKAWAQEVLDRQRIGPQTEHGDAGESATGRG
jgi:hypothetical protein